MDKAVEQSPDYYELLAWLHANRQRVIAISAAVIVIGAAIGIYFWHNNYRETQANIALSDIKLPTPVRGAQPIPPDGQPYIDVANQYSGTSAGSRALLLGAEAYFDAGKFDQAQAQFGRFLGEYPDSPLANQAALGVAASLEAAGKVTEAATRYNDLINRHPNSSIIPQAKSALARLYVAQNKPELAAPIYEELARANNNDTWSAEAGIQLEELLAKYPQLRKPPPAPAPTTSAPGFELPPSMKQAPAPAPAKAGPASGPTHPVPAPTSTPAKPASSTPASSTNK